MLPARVRAGRRSFAAGASPGALAALLLAANFIHPETVIV
jgi:hypothetical protein